MSLFSCSKPPSFEVRANYRSAENSERQYSVFTAGTYLSGADMVDAYHGRIIVILNNTNHQLNIKAEHFTPKLDNIDLPLDFMKSNGQVVDSALLAQFILHIDKTVTREQVNKEAEELFSILEAAGMGPKIGLPDTKALTLVSVSNEYR